MRTKKSRTSEFKVWAPNLVFIGMVQVGRNMFEGTSRLFAFRLHAESRYHGQRLDGLSLDDTNE